VKPITALTSCERTLHFGLQQRMAKNNSPASAQPPPGFNWQDTTENMCQKLHCHPPATPATFLQSYQQRTSCIAAVISLPKAANQRTPVQLPMNDHQQLTATGHNDA
jgi:hypothetical protein